MERPCQIICNYNLLDFKKNMWCSTENSSSGIYFHPNSEEAHMAIQCQVELQKRAGGNAIIR